MPLDPLRSVLATPLHSERALPVAGSLGFGLGAAIEFVCNAARPTWTIGDVMQPGLIGGWLAIAWLKWLRFLEREGTLTELQEHELALVDYPDVRQALRGRGTSVNDPDALKVLAREIEGDVNRMTRQFDAYCSARDMPPNPLMRGVIRHFYLSHLRFPTIMLLSKLRSTDCYLVAGHVEQRDTITDALSQDRVPAGTVLRQLHCPYMRVDLANNALRGARAFSTEDCEGEMRVHSVHTLPGETLETVAPSAPPTLTRRRVKSSHVGVSGSTSTKSALPDLVSSTHPAPKKIVRGPLLLEKLAGLKPDSRTWRELDRIEQDLAAGRTCGHLVRVNGVLYHAIDIHFEGRLSPGRNAWRLLYDGRELFDIVDYH